MRYLIAFLLMALPAQAQPLWRNFFTTNQNPRVIVTAGSNVTVQASTVGVNQRIYTVNSVPPIDNPNALTNSDTRAVSLAGGLVVTGGNITTSGTVTPTNGIIFQGKHSFTTNFTAIESIQLYNCNGTNLVVTLPNCTNTAPWKVYRFSQTNRYSSLTLTNANGLQTIHNGIDLSYSVRSGKSTALYHDGAHWWLAVPDQPNFPNAQFSCSTNIPLTAANTAYPVTFNSTDFNNSLGIALGAGTNGLASKMWITNSGVYEFSPSVVQIFNGNDTIRFWFRTFDTNVPASATPSKGQNGSIRVITVPFIINVTEPTPVEIWAESDTTGESLPAEAASGNYPAAPSVICPVKMISNPWP